MSFFSRLGAAVKALRGGGPSFSGMGGGWWGVSQTIVPGGLNQGLFGPLPGSQYDYATAAGDLRLSAVVAACVAWMQRTFPEPRLMVVDSKDGKTEKENHPLTALLRRPNPYYSGDRLWQATLPDWVTTGNAYWLKRFNQGGQVVQLWYLPAGKMRPVWPVGGPTEVFVEGYEYRVDGFPYRYRPEEIVHFRFGQHPQNERLGWSPLAAGLREVASLNEGATYRGAILRNMGIVGASLIPANQEAAQALLEGGNEVAAGRVATIKARWKALFTGDNRGGLFVPTFAAKLEKAGFSPQELDIREMLAWDADMICSLLGLSSMVVGLPAAVGHDTYANHDSAEQNAVLHNLMPTQRLMAEDLEIQLLPDMGDPAREGLAWDYSEVRALKEDQDAVWKRVWGAWSAGGITRAQALTAVGETPAKDGSDDVYLLPTGAQLIGKDNKPVNEPDTPAQPPLGDPNGPSQTPAPVDSQGDRAAALNGRGAAAGPPRR